jgi:hypothetical protein
MNIIRTRSSVSTTAILIVGALSIMGVNTATAQGVPSKVASVDRFIAMSRARSSAPLPQGRINAVGSGGPNRPFSAGGYPSVPLGGVNKFLAGNVPQSGSQYASVPLGGVNRFLSGNPTQPAGGYLVPLGGVNRFLSGN